MSSKWEPHAEKIEAMFKRGDSYRTISTAIKEQHGLPLDPAGLYRWWRNKLAKRRARAAALRTFPKLAEPVLVTTAAAHAAAVVQEEAVRQILEQKAEKTDQAEAATPTLSKERQRSIALRASVERAGANLAAQAKEREQGVEQQQHKELGMRR